MWREAGGCWIEVGYAFQDALWATAAALFGKRLHGGKLVRLGPYTWVTQTGTDKTSDPKKDP